jgi:hypothetical protein
MKTINPPSVNVQAQSRFMKLLFFVMVFSVGLNWAVLSFTGQNPAPLSELVKNGRRGCALAIALVVLFVSFNKIAGVLDPDMPIPTAERLAKLRTYFIISFVFAESVALIGSALCFLGASIEEVVPFFVGCLILYALCYPRLPTDLEGSQTSLIPFPPD